MPKVKKKSEYKDSYPPIMVRYSYYMHNKSILLGNYSNNKNMNKTKQYEAIKYKKKKEDIIKNDKSCNNNNKDSSNDKSNLEDNKSIISYDYDSFTGEYSNNKSEAEENINKIIERENKTNS